MVGVAARLFLAAVLILAGVSKLIDRPGARRAITEFGVSRRFATLLAILVPVGELGVAVGLLADWGLVWGVIAATASALAAVLVGGSALFVEVLRRTRRLLSRSKRLRSPLDALDSWLERASYRLWVLRARRRWPGGLPVGSRAPRFRFPGLEGRLLTLDSLLKDGKPVMLLFVADPSASVGGELLVELTTQVPTVLVSRKAERGVMRANGRPPSRILFQDHWEMLQVYRVFDIPSAVLVRPDGRIGSPVAAGVDEIRRLAATSAQK
jgi:hypothetical protein